MLHPNVSVYRSERSYGLDHEDFISVEFRKTHAGSKFQEVGHDTIAHCTAAARRIVRLPEASCMP